MQDFQKRRQAGQESAESWLWAHLHRIASANATVQAVKELNPQAEALARESDRAYDPHSAGILHGVPVLVKDNIAVAGAMHTTAGAQALAGAYALSDAFIVQRLRAAGAIVLGKTNMTEWANFMSDHMPNGFSAGGAQVMNPYGPDTWDVGGSSSGSGAALAAEMAPLAVGTETSGSILSPATQNSLVGIKPTVGLLSRTGIVPIAHSQDTAGPMARTVADAAILLSLLQGYDPADPVTGSAPRTGDYLADLVPGGLKNRRLGVPREGYVDGLTDEELALFEAGLKILRDQGAFVEDPADIATVAQAWTYDVMLYEFHGGVNAFLAQKLMGAPRSLREVIAYNTEHGSRAMPYGQDVLLESEKLQGRLTDARYLQARWQDLQWSRGGGIDKTMEQHRLDALVFFGSQGADIAARAGYPSITVPLGYTKMGKPVGLTFTSGAFQESLLIRLAYGFEQATHARRSPSPH